MFAVVSLVCLSLVLWCSEVEGHGLMTEPPSRNYLGLFMDKNKCKAPGGQTPRKNWNNMALNCGGRSHQHNANGGKCGACGDSYSDTNRPHEFVYNTSIITATYYQGCKLHVKIKLTAPHKGWFEFRLCHDVSASQEKPTRERPSTSLDECFESDASSQLLKFADSNTYKSTNTITSGPATYEYDLLLPPDIFCAHCVLRWIYTTNNSPGSPPEMFINCADIAIIQRGDTVETSNIVDDDRLMSCETFETEPMPKSCHDAPSIENNDNNNNDNNNNNYGNNNNNYDNNNNGGWGSETTTPCADSGNNGSLKNHDDDGGTVGNPDSTEPALSSRLVDQICRLMKDHLETIQRYEECCRLACQDVNRQDTCQYVYQCSHSD